MDDPSFEPDGLDEFYCVCFSSFFFYKLSAPSPCLSAQCQGGVMCIMPPLWAFMEQFGCPVYRKHFSPNRSGAWALLCAHSQRGEPWHRSPAACPHPHSKFSSYKMNLCWRLRKKVREGKGRQVREFNVVKRKEHRRRRRESQGEWLMNGSPRRMKVKCKERERERKCVPVH